MGEILHKRFVYIANMYIFAPVTIITVTKIAQTRL
jgi:hypothetical protein